MSRALTFYSTSIGKKVVMAITGLILFGFVIGHMLGNLQVFMGAKQMNAYAAMLGTFAISRMVCRRRDAGSWMSFASG